MFEGSDKVDKILRAFDICCTKDHQAFQPSEILCYYSNACLIHKYETYFSYKNKYNICQNCFNSIKGKSVMLGYYDMDLHQAEIKLCQFSKIKNDQRIPEPLVECMGCGSVQHAICVLHNDSISPKGFTCNTCLKRNSSNRPAHIYTSQNLSNTKLSCHIEARVVHLLEMKEATCCKVNIRVVSAVDKTLRIPQIVKDRFAESGQIMSDMPYRCKVIMAFQLIDGFDVCFFAMAVQEYDSDCPAPNTRRISISYVDSVNFFTPKQLRTDVYHEILLGYLEYVKQLGYITAHIWSCPARKDQGYLFNYRPTEQKIPDGEQLELWYQTVLNKGITSGIVIKYDQKLKATKEFLASYPYFLGDFWSNMISETIYELHIEEKKKGETKTMDGESDTDVKKGSELRSCSLGERLLQKVTDAKDCNSKFFIVHLNSTDCTAGPIIDPDHLNVRYFAQEKFELLTSSSQLHLEFNSLRKAKFSSMTIIYNILEQYDDQFASYCNMCKNWLIIGYKCNECCYYNLCSYCYEGHKHPHEMIDFKFSPASHETWSPNKYNENSYKMHCDWLRRHMQMISHSYCCEDDDCKFTWCLGVRSIFNCRCQKKSQGGCSICSELIHLCTYHASKCTQLRCEMPYCQEIQLSLMNRRNNHMLNHRAKLAIKKYCQNKTILHIIPLLSPHITLQKLISFQKISQIIIYEHVSFLIYYYCQFQKYALCSVYSSFCKNCII